MYASRQAGSWSATWRMSNRFFSFYFPLDEISRHARVCVWVSLYAFACLYYAMFLLLLPSQNEKRKCCKQQFFNFCGKCLSVSQVFYGGTSSGYLSLPPDDNGFQCSIGILASHFYTSMRKYYFVAVIRKYADTEQIGYGRQYFDIYYDQRDFIWNMHMYLCVCNCAVNY